MTHRDTQISILEKTKVWDVVIIGGGSSGLGIAVDAASRGLKTVLFEQYDFAKGTSGKSTKLVHGGVRYLAQGNIGLVKTALKERGLLAKNARHLFKRQEFIIPNYKWWEGLFYVTGLKLYDRLSKRSSLGSSRRMKKQTVIQRFPTLRTHNLYSGVSYFDGQFDDARLALNLAQTAIEKGGTVFNYMKVVGLIKGDDNRIKGVRIEDVETQKKYEVACGVLVNATGIFTDKILKMYNPDHKKTVVPSQGIHLMLDASCLRSESALMIPKTSDGRILFIIPWYDKVIVGTTDTLIKKPKIEPLPLEQEVDFILETLNNYLNKTVTRADVLSVFSGLRPLAKPKKDATKTKEISRSHKIIVEENMVSILGGKWTTYRRMAQDVVDTLIKNFGFEKVPSSTGNLSIHGNIPENAEPPNNHLYIYGSEIDDYRSFEAQSPVFSERIHRDYPYTKGQVVWSVRNEMARTVEDFLARRIRLLLLDARAAIEAAPVVSDIMAGELNTPKTVQRRKLSEFIALANQYILK